MFPWAAEKQKKKKDLIHLLESGAAFVDGDVAVDVGKEECIGVINGVDVHSEEVGVDPVGCKIYLM